MSVTINISVAKTKTSTKYPCGTIFAKDDTAYILAIHRLGESNYATLVNMKTGDSIHQLKEVANKDYVTAEELKSINFKKSTAAVCVE